MVNLKTWREMTWRLKMIRVKIQYRDMTEKQCKKFWLDYPEEDSEGNIRAHWLPFIGEPHQGVARGVHGVPDLRA